MHLAWHDQARMPRWVLTQELATLAWEYDPHPEPDDPTEQATFIDLPWVA